LTGKFVLAYRRDVADVYKALADETRRALLDELAMRDEQTLFELCSKLAVNHDLTPTRQAVSQHRDVLEQAGLVRTERRGRYKFHTVVDPDRPDGTQISLEPKDHPAVTPFTDALTADGIPFCTLGVDNVQAEYDRLVALGETFTQPPTAMGPVIVAVLDDRCGNLLQLAQYTG
jgi:DNA-binding transcriptional ArsR family regulator